LDGSPQLTQKETGGIVSPVIAPPPENAGTGRLSRLSRWSPLSGIAFAVLFLLSTGALGAGTPGPEVTDDAIVRYYEDSRNQVKAEIAYALLTLGAVLFLWFSGTLAA
jgi:hypothetical protein